MSSQAHAERLARALESTRMIQSVETSFRPDQVTVLFRVLSGADMAWNSMMIKLLNSEGSQSKDAPGWRLDISKKYLLKNDKLVFGWRISLQANDMSYALDTLNAVIKGEVRATPRGELEEMTFTGFEGARDRNVPKPGSKKGAYNGETNPTR